MDTAKIADLVAANTANIPGDQHQDLLSPFKELVGGVRILAAGTSPRCHRRSPTSTGTTRNGKMQRNTAGGHVRSCQETGRPAVLLLADRRQVLLYLGGPLRAALPCGYGGRSLPFA